MSNVLRLSTSNCCRMKVVVEIYPTSEERVTKYFNNNPMSIESVLQAGFDPKDFQSKVQELIDRDISIGSFQVIKDCVEKLFNGAIPQQSVKPVAIYISSKLYDLLNSSEFESVVSQYITAIRQQQSGGLFDEAEYFARDAMSNYYLNCQQFKDAAVVLAGINFDSSSYVISPVQRANIFVKCAECCLEDDEAVDAEVFVNKASGYMNEVADKYLQLRYRAVSARVLDSNRKFMEASKRYHDLSCNTEIEIAHEDLVELLGKAITCAILSKAGPQRSRLLGALSKDEKLRFLDQLPNYTSHTIILHKMFHEQILTKDEMLSFVASLLPHQKAITADGLTIPEKAIIEHNLVAASNLYENITIDELNLLLGLEKGRTEKLVAKMISEDRLKARIDQTLSLVCFESDESSSDVDVRIKAVCDDLTSCVNYIKLKNATSN